MLRTTDGVAEVTRRFRMSLRLSDTASVSATRSCQKRRKSPNHFLTGRWVGRGQLPLLQPQDPGSRALPRLRGGQLRTCTVLVGETGRSLPIAEATHAPYFLKNGDLGQLGWLSGLAPPSAQGLILETRDRVPCRAPCREPASPSACVSASLSLCISHE